MELSRREIMLGTSAFALAGSTSAWAGSAPATVDAQRLSARLYRAASKKLMVPMRDGVELMATVVHPEDAPVGTRLPVILNLDPYRRSDTDGIQAFSFFAERGYHCVYLDVRGTGGSGGRSTPNQYSEEEQRDALDAIAWFARQPWCNGSVGLQGSSYGGFNSIQIAMLQPPALKAIIPTFATDDVYADDIIYYGGALQGEALGRWPFSMIATMGLPAPPDLNTTSSEARYRVEHEPWLFDMLRHQTDDQFWQRQSLRPDYSRIKVPTMMFAGWLDAYTDSVPRMIDKLTVPRRAIIGPWTHGMGLPGPAIHSDLERLRWWDQWLKGVDTNVLTEPRLAIYMNESYKPRLDLPEVPGYWRSENSWPKGKELRLYPQPGGTLSRTRRAPLKRDLAYKPTVGMTNRYRCPHNSAELPVDQRPDDNFSLCFDTPELERESAILGTPKASLYVSATAPVATWIVRLCDVAPDGTSTLVSKGILNGCHRVSRTQPEAMVPGQVYRLEIDLKAISWIFPRGHKIRIAVCNADFPNLWPSPYAMTTSLYSGPTQDSHVILPLCLPAALPAPRFEPLPAPTAAVAAKPVNHWTVTRDEMAGTVTVFRETATPSARPGSFSGFERRWLTVADDNPANTVLRAEGKAERQRGADMIRVDTAMRMESDVTSFAVKITRTLSVNGTIKFTKTWEDRMSRHFT